MTPANVATNGLAVRHGQVLPISAILPALLQHYRLQLPQGDQDLPIDQRCRPTQVLRHSPGDIATSEHLPC
jgi:hypothetical protein